MNAIETLVAVIPMLGILIFVHELGHFLVAKACGVRVLKFSLGFGSPVGIGNYRMRWERGGTEYVVAWFPLGGFVKMLGEQLDTVQGEEPEVPDARPDEFLSAKPTWQKLAITFAGPAMNLALPVFAFLAVLMVGLPRPAAIVGTVEPASPAAVAGLQAGDQVLAVDGERTRFWHEVDDAIRKRTSGTVLLEVERAGDVRRAVVPVAPRSGLGDFGDVSQVGWIGIESARLPALLGVLSGESPAAVAGLRSGDRVTAVGETAVESWEEFRRAYEVVSSGSVALTVERDPPPSTTKPEREGEPPAPVRSEMAVPALGDVEALGVAAAAILISAVEADTPAARAGLVPGDLVLAVDGRPIGSFTSFVEIVRTSGGREMELTVGRGGELVRARVAPELASVPGPLGIEGMDEEAYRIGTRHVVSLLPGEMTVDRELNPLVAFPRAIEMTLDTTRRFLMGLRKIFTGEIGTDKLAGPIGIAQIARRSLDLGWQVYLSTMILISINLGILNLLPIPVLDGGQALIYAVEGLRRGPISVRSREIVQSFGLVVLLALMGLAFWNDISRNWASFIEWLGGGS